MTTGSNALHYITFFHPKRIFFFWTLQFEIISKEKVKINVMNVSLA